MGRLDFENTRTPTFLLLLLWMCSRTQGINLQEDFEHMLLKDVLLHYNKDARPVLNKSDAVKVKLDIAYSQLVDLDGKKQILSSKIWIRLTWHNPFLVWNSSDYGGLKSVNVDPKMVWRPDLVLYNNIGIGQTGALYNFDTKVQILSDGTTFWYAPTEIKSICKIDIKSFPFDEQYCPLIIGSWAYSMSQLNLENKSETADLSKYTVSGEWDLIAVPIKRNIVKYSCCPDPYIDVTFVVHVRRKVLFYLTNLILPCVVLAVLTVFSFYLPPESGERISLVITILLGLTVFMLVFTENVPRTSEVIPLIGKYSFTVMCEVSVSLLVTCGIVRIYHKNPNYPLPVWFRHLTFHVLAPMFRMTPPKHKDKRDGSGSKNSNCDKCTSRLITHPPYMYMTKIREALFRGQITTSSGENKSLADNEECFSNVAGETVNSQSYSDQKLDDIFFSLCNILEHMREVRTTDMNRGDWHFAAQVVDALFFWVFAITMVVSSIIFIFMIP